MLEAYCERREQCSGWAEFAQIAGGCVAEERDYWLSAAEEVQPAVANGRFVYEPSAAQACVEARRNAACDDPRGGFPDECERVFYGTVPPGGECAANLECTGSAVCQGCPGRCVARVGPGEACDAERPCEIGSRCTDGVCAVLARDGEACDEQAERGLHCAGYEVCDRNNPTVASKCRAFRRVNPGNICDPAAGIVCPDAQACVAVERLGAGLQQRCRERSKPGGKCWSGSQDTCPTGQYCPLSQSDQLQGVLSATCLPLAREGERCYSQYGCDAGALCLGAVCVPIKPLGEACLQREECLSDECVGGTCSRPDVCAPSDTQATMLRDPAPPGAGCPTKVPDTLLGTFDTSIDSWETRPVRRVTDQR